MELSAHQGEVLHALLDRYERRRDYGRLGKSARRVLLPIDKRGFPPYFHVSDSSFRLMFNQEMEALERLRWVELDWVRFDRGNTLQRVALVEEALPAVYRALGRRPRKQLYREAAVLLAEYEKAAPAELCSLCRALGERLALLQPLPPPLKAEQPRHLLEYLWGLGALFETRDGDIARRLLSVRLYGDSKRWEQLQGGILQLARSFCLPPGEAGLDDTALLAERGIIDHPGHILLFGSLVFCTPRGEVDLAAFYPDLGLPVEMARELEIVASEAAAVMTVENKTSFYQYLREGPPGQLVIYLGGYHNRGRRILLEKLYAYFKKERAGPSPFYTGAIWIWAVSRSGAT